MTPQLEVSRLLDTAGAVLVRSNGHRVYRFPDGTNWITPCTPSDWRSWSNNLAGLKRRLGIRPAAKFTPRRFVAVRKLTPPTNDKRVWREYLVSAEVQPL